MPYLHQTGPLLWSLLQNAVSQRPAVGASSSILFFSPPKKDTLENWNMTLKRIVYKTSLYLSSFGIIRSIESSGMYLIKTYIASG